MDVSSLKKVIILVGGPSAEATVSRSTGAGMAKACAELGLNHEVWELEGDWMARLSALPKEGTFVLIGLHGAPGEDGTIQGVLELLGLPYQGSGVQASAIGIDKIASRNAFDMAGVPIAAAALDPTLEHAEVFLEMKEKIVIKPALAGSSVGVHVLSKVEDVATALEDAKKYGPFQANNPVLAEEFIEGIELTVGMLGNEALPVIEIVPQGSAQNGLAYDFNAKYTEGGSSHVIPAKISEDMTKIVQQAALRAGRAVGATGAYRVDFRYNKSTQHVVALEINTLPGMTPTSLLPDAAAASGKSYTALVRWMMEDGLRQWSLKRAPKI